MRSTRHRLGTVVGLAALMAGVLVGPAWATPHSDKGHGSNDGPATGPTARHDPPGNNGTIKIDDEPFDSAPDNEPHPGCVFQVDFYGFDEGSLDADVSFEAIAPTAGGVVRTDVVPIGEDSHAGGGSEAGLDASRTYDLSADLAGIAPHPRQGWHVRLTIHADGSQGADVKHKVFWVSDCAGASSQSETMTPPPASTSSEVDTQSTAQAPPASETAIVAAPNAQVLGESITRAAATPAESSGASALARTGIGLGLVALGTGLIAAGALFLRARRSRLSGLVAS
jgi:hypothetical protein